MRLFIAINFQNEVLSRLLALRDDLCSQSLRGRFTAPKNLHLTLVFLGECDTQQANAAKTAMDAIRFEPFFVEIVGIGHFKRNGRNGGDTWWAGVQECKPLLDLQRDLTRRLTAAGFALPSKKYSPHITLGREITTEVIPCQIESFGEKAYAIDLMESELNGGGPIYRIIYTKEASNRRALF